MTAFFSSPKDAYSQEEFFLSREEVHRMISTVHIKTLSQGEEHLVQDAILTRRGGDGRISMRQIYEVLLSLDERNLISEFDRKALLKLFQELSLKK